MAPRSTIRHGAAARLTIKSSTGDWEVGMSRNVMKEFDTCDGRSIVRNNEDTYITAMSVAYTIIIYTCRYSLQWCTAVFITLTLETNFVFNFYYSNLCIIEVITKMPLLVVGRKQCMKMYVTWFL